MILEKQQISILQQQIWQLKSGLIQTQDPDFKASILQELSSLETQLADMLREQDSQPYELPEYDSQQEKWIDLTG